VSAVRWLDTVLVPADAQVLERVFVVFIYIVAAAFALGGLWALLSVLVETQPRFGLRAHWRCVRRKTRPVRALGAAMLEPFKR
jgi:hypothetical protein